MYARIMPQMTRHCLVLAFGVALAERACPAVRIVEASDFARPNPNRVQVDFAPFD